MKKSLFCLCMSVVFWHGYACAGYVDNNNGTITDTSTGLMWEKSTGLTTYTWAQAMAYCENLTLGGQSDWRLPTRNELQSIVDYNNYNPSISISFFPDTVASVYWSSTPLAYNTSSAWIVNFNYGYVYFDDKTYYNDVRAVRAGQCGSFGSSTTTTTPGGTTTTTTPGKKCPIAKALGDNDPNVEQLRDFRDGKLAQSTVGRKVIQIYYNNADSINAALENSPVLQATARRVLEVIAPMVGGKE